MVAVSKQHPSSAGWQRSSAADLIDARAGETIKGHGYAADTVILSRGRRAPLTSADEVRAFLETQPSNKPLALSGKNAEQRDALLQEFRRQPELGDGRMIKVLRNSSIVVVPAPITIDRFDQAVLGQLNQRCAAAVELNAPVRIKIGPNFPYAEHERTLCRALAYWQEKFPRRDFVIEVDPAQVDSLKHFISVKRVVPLEPLAPASQQLRREDQQLAEASYIQRRLAQMQQNEEPVPAPRPKTWYQAIVSALQGEVAAQNSESGRPKLVLWMRRAEFGEVLHRALGQLAATEAAKGVVVYRYTPPDHIAQTRVLSAPPAAAATASGGESQPRESLWARASTLIRGNLARLSGFASRSQG